MTWTIHTGNAIDVLRSMPSESVHCCVTSPPYWGLRDYGVDGQIGLESTPEQYVERMVEVFREVRRVLRKDGTLWLNLGESYAGSGRGMNGDGSPGKVGAKQASNAGSVLDLSGDIVRGKRIARGEGSGRWGGGDKDPGPGYKPKDLIGIPWRVAFALQADGWWLRSDIIWVKPNPMPESVTDRPTKAHEYIFLLSKSAKYYYDAEAIKEPSVCPDDSTPEDVARALNRKRETQIQPRLDKIPSGWNTGEGAHNTIAGRYPKAKGGKNAFRGQGAHRTTETGPANREGRDMKDVGAGTTRNKRSVWTVATEPFPGAHFATFPTKLIEPCILAGSPEQVCPTCGAPWERVVARKPAESKECPKTQAAHEARGGTSKPTGTVGKSGSGRIEGYAITTGFRPTCSCPGNDGSGKGVVLDPFTGSGTVGVVALRHNRSFIGSDLKAEYVEMANNRIRDDAPLLNVSEGEGS